MRFLTRDYLKKQFDFKYAGKWLVLGSIIGVVSGIGAILLQSFLSLIKGFSFGQLMGLDPSSPGGEMEVFHFPTGVFVPVLVVLIPTLGGLLSGFIVRTFAPEAEGHGTDEVIKSFHWKRGIIRPIVPLIKLISSGITIGTGGSGGREGPIAQIGAGFGSFLGIRMGMNTKSRRWLLAAGMGAGIGSIFHAPLAGALFSAEVLYSDPEVESEVILPSTVASIIAYSIYSSVFGWKHMFIETSGMGFSNPLELIPYLVLALTLAVVANFFVKIFYRTRNAFKSLSITPFLKPAIGGFLTGTFGLALILIFDDKKFVVDVMGGGYGILQEIFYNGTANVSISVLLLIGFGKILTTSFSIGSGGSAGVFGPSMVIGGTIGTAVGFLLQPVFPDIIANPVTFTVVGMAGFFAAAANTPISTIIMVSELTGNYELLLPSMWVCSIAYLVSRKWSIFENQVPNKTFSKAHFSKYAPDIINVTTVGESYRRSRKFNLIRQDSSLADIREVVDKSRQRIFPVVDENEIMQGVFNIDDVTHILHYPDPLIRTASDLMNPNCTVVYPDQTLLEVSKLMSFNAVDELMVVDSPENKKVKGIITSSDIVLAYSRKLSEIKYGADIEEQYSEEVLLLKSLALKNVIEKDLLTISHDATLGELVSVIIKSKRNIFPVVDTSRHLTGIVLLNDIRKLMFDTSKYDNVHIKEIMIKPPEIVIITDNFETIINKFEKSGAWNLPVVDKKKVYQGLVSKSRIFSAYRNALIEQSKN